MGREAFRYLLSWRTGEPWGKQRRNPPDSDGSGGRWRSSAAATGRPPASTSFTKACCTPRGSPGWIYGSRVRGVGVGFALVVFEAYHRTSCLSRSG